MESPMTESDETLISRAVRLKDKAAFAELVRRYEKKVFLLQYRLAGERALAEDLAQETFLRAWQKLESFRGTGSFGGWLASLAYNIFRAHWRKHRRLADEVPIEEVEVAAPERTDTDDADLERLLGALNREDQVILTLTYAYGLSNTEVAAVLDMPAGTVKARIHRAKVRIQAQIDSPRSPSDERASTSDEPATGSTREDRSRRTARRLAPAHPSTPAGPLTC